MKSLKSIIIAGIVLIVLIVASVIIMNIPASSDGDLEEASTVEAAKESVYVVDREYSDLVRFTVVPTEREVTEDTEYAYASEALDVQITKTEDEEGSVSYEYEVAPDPGKFEYNTSMFRSMMYTLSSITATNMVEENAGDISIYGLDEPTALVETYYNDGTQIDIIIGSQAPVDGEYYCMTSESSNVYTIGSYVDSLLIRRPIEYRDITLFPPYTEDDIYTNIDWVSMTSRKGETIEILLDQNQDHEANTEGSQYVMLQPYQVSGNTTTIQGNILDIVSTLTLGAIVKDITEDEYAEYGLDNPAKLEMRDISGNEVHLLVGDTCPNVDYTYCMLEGTDTLLTASSSAFTCLDTSYVQFMLRTAWTFNIEQLQGIDIKIGDAEHDIDVTHYVKQNANGNDADGVLGTLNGVDIIETNVRRLYIKCLYFRIVGNLTEDEKAELENVDPYATITIKLENEDGEAEEHLLELIPLSDRKYAMRVDGEMEYYCQKKNLTDLEDSIRYVEEGDELDFNIG